MVSPAEPRVLVVDDVEALRTLIGRVLAGSGYRVDVAASLPEAQAMDPWGYDAVVIDAYLGEERGAVLIEALRAEDPASLRRCLMITGRGPGVVPPGVASLIKPFSPDNLLAAVQALVQPESAGRTGGRAAGPRAPAAPGADPGPPRSRAGTAGATAAGSPASRQSAWWLLGLARQLRAEEQAILADSMHDGPVQELTAAMLGLETLARRAPGDLAPRFEQLQHQLSLAARATRRLVDEGMPLIQPDASLPAVIRQRAAWLPLSSVHTDVRNVAANPEPEVPAIADVIELALFVMADNARTAQADVLIQMGGQAIEILLTLTPPQAIAGGTPDPAAVRATLTQLALALGGTAHVGFAPSAWRARIRLPRQSTA